MTITVDPDDITLATDNSVSTGNVWFNTSTQRIGIDPSYDSNMDDDGLTFQCLYSFAKEVWQANQSYAAFPFPFTPITDNSFEVIEGWDFEGTDVEDKTTRHLAKSAGWNVRNTSGAITQTWAGVRALGNADAVTNEAIATYLDLGEGSGAVQTLEGSYISDTKTTLPINEPFMVYRNDDGSGSLSGSDFDLTGQELVLYIREYGLTYARAGTAALGVSTLENVLYSLPIGTISTDSKISASFSDANGGAAPYSGMSIEFENSAQSESLGSNGPFNFGVTVAANGGSVQQVYEHVQAKLLSATDIDATTGGTATQYGRLLAEFVEFVGDTLITRATDTPDAGGSGVYIDNFLSTQTALCQMTDNTGTVRVFPTLAPITINIGANGQSDTDTIYRLYYAASDAYASAADSFGSETAVLVDDSTGADIGGDVDSDSGYSAGVITKTYAYDDDQAGSGSGGNDRNVVLVVIGLSGAQYVTAEGTITSSGVTLSAAPALERNYDNPA